MSAEGGERRRVRPGGDGDCFGGWCGYFVSGSGNSGGRPLPLWETGCAAWGYTGLQAIVARGQRGCRGCISVAGEKCYAFLRQFTPFYGVIFSLGVLQQVQNFRVGGGAGKLKPKGTRRGGI